MTTRYKPKGKAFKKARNNFKKMSETITDVEFVGVSEQKGFIWMQDYLGQLDEEGRRRQLMGDMRWSPEKGIIELLLANVLALRVQVAELGVQLGAFRRLTQEEKELIDERAKGDGEEDVDSNRREDDREDTVGRDADSGGLVGVEGGQESGPSKGIIISPGE